MTTQKTIDVSKFSDEMVEKMRDTLEEMQRCGDVECLFVVGGANTVQGGEEGMKTTARFVGIKRPLDMIMLLSAMVRSMDHIFRLTGAPAHATHMAAHAAVDFAIDKVHGPQPVDSERGLDDEPDSVAKTLADAMLAGIMKGGKPQVH